MGVTIVVCPCGRRLKTAALVPGARGRCPDCGRSLRMPAAPVPAAEAPRLPPGEEEDEWNWQGPYDLTPSEPTEKRAGGPLADPWADELEGPLDAASEVVPAEDDEWNWQGPGYDLDEIEAAVAPPESESGPEPAGASIAYDEAERTAIPVPTDRRPKSKAAETDAKPPAPPWWPPPLLYPLRAFEGLAMATVLGLVFWVLATLVPEYCLAIFADSVKLGTPSMGRLVAVISSLPSVILVPAALVYWLQYLGRVLTASAEGEAAPPRPPDRNFEGLFTGLGCWFVWLVAGLGVALLPLGAYLAASTTGAVGWSPAIALVLGLAGLPYAAAALMLAFLHDDSLAILPPSVLGSLVRLGPLFPAACLTAAATLGLAGLVFAEVLSLRDKHFWVYLPACLGAWIAAFSLSFVAMHTLGAYYAPRAKRLKWRRVRIRWGAS